MPLDATHLVFAHAAAQRTNPRVLRPELLAGAVAPDSVGVDRFLPMASSHLVVRKVARHYARLAAGDGVAATSYALGYLSHVWLDRFLFRWFPRHPLEADAKRMNIRELYAMIAQRDVEEALRLWRSFTPAREHFAARLRWFVDPVRLQRYCADVERRLGETPGLDFDVEASAIFASERLRVAALEAFSQALGTAPRTGV